VINFAHHFSQFDRLRAWQKGFSLDTATEAPAADDVRSAQRWIPTLPDNDLKGD
jgi:hypothetical protein